MPFVQGLGATFTQTLTAAGKAYPSIEDVPAGGCWHFELGVAEQHWALDLDYAP